MLYGAWEHIYSQQVSWLRHLSNAMEEEFFSTDDGTLGAYMKITRQKLPDEGINQDIRQLGPIK